MPKDQMGYCEDAGCCGCCTPFTEQDQREAEEAYWEAQDALEPDDESYDSMDEPDDCDEPWDGRTDAEADAETLASAGMGMDEDYRCDMLCEGYDEH